MTPVTGDQTERTRETGVGWGEANLPAGFPPPGPVDEIVIKQYPAYRAAIKLADSPGGGEQNEMFWPLFQHIKKHDIAMTAPVEMTYETPQASTSDEVSPRIRAMAFMYAKPDMGTPGPDDAVVVTDLPAMTVLSIGVRGSYSNEHFQMALTQLQNWMLENPGRLTQSGSPRYLGYNSPFVPWFLRYGEVQLPVTVVEPGQVQRRSE
ncbi:MAG: ABC transporter substrate-binding protein [Phycisphaerales bacterium]|nr:ABC transporter substrate-binding protein [Phycisphaerales bacterium]